MAVLIHNVRGPEHPADMGRNFTKQARIIDRAKSLGLPHELEYEDWTTYLWVRGPRPTLEALARYADEELNRTVDIEEEDETFAPAIGADSPLTTVMQLGTGEYVGAWALPAEEAVVAAYAQLEKRDFNTWRYGEKYRGEVVFNRLTVRCGNYTALRSGPPPENAAPNPSREEGS